MRRSRYFRIDWVLVDQLAIGPAPRAERFLINEADVLRFQPLFNR